MLQTGSPSLCRMHCQWTARGTGMQHQEGASSHARPRPCVARAAFKLLVYPCPRHEQRPLLAKQVLALLRGFPSLGLCLGLPSTVARVASPALTAPSVSKGGILSLSGTIPITYHGERYSIPVSAAPGGSHHLLFINRVA